MICRICETKTIFLEKVTNCRLEQYKLNKKPSPPLVTKDVSLWQCPHCSHIQSEYCLDSNYYEGDYSEYSGYKQYVGGFNITEQRIKKLFSHLKSKQVYSQNRLIDIGCGCGDALMIAEKYFDSCLGIEVSSTADVAISRGCNVIKDYFSKELNITDEYSAISTFQTMEHIEDLSIIMEGIFQTLPEGGVALINVPNGLEILNSNLYHQIINEHINYYTPMSLVELVSNHGFELISVENIDNLIELDIYFRKPIKNAKSNFNFTKSQQGNSLNNALLPFSSIGLWGAGAKATTYAELLDDNSNIKHYFDSDINKASFYINGINLPVQQPTSVGINQCDIIVILATSYKDQIKDTLTNDYGYKGAILYFDEDSIEVI